MKSCNFDFNAIYKNTVFLHNLDDFAQKISQKLPFSNILILSTDSDFFDFGKAIYDKLLEKGSKVQCALLNDNFTSQLNDLFCANNLLKEFRGVVVFNKQILCHILGLSDIKFIIFYLQCSSDIYGIFNNRKNQSFIQRYFYITNIDKNILLKNLSVRTLCLIDYIFCQVLTNGKIDQLFFIKLKRLLVLALSIVDGEQTSESLFNFLVVIEKMFALKNEAEYFSSNVACYLMGKDYYHLETNFCASKQIVKKYSNMLLKRQESQISYSERAKLVSFFSGEDINVCLKSINMQLNKLCTKLSMEYKNEIKSLIKIYEKLACQIKKVSLENNNKTKKEELLKRHKLEMCVSVCGDTPLSINGMSLVRQMSFLI